MDNTKQRTRVAAYGLVVQDQKLLLCRISSELPKWQGYWTLPGGGVEFGEAPQDAMVREVQEETGMLVSPQTILAINSLHDRQSVPEIHGIRIIYCAIVVGGELTNEKAGTTDLARWFSQKQTRKQSLVDIAQQGVELALETE